MLSINLNHSNPDKALPAWIDRIPENKEAWSNLEVFSTSSFIWNPELNVRNEGKVKNTIGSIRETEPPPSPKSPSQVKPSGKSPFYCEPCKKPFTSRPTFENHLKSQKHQSVIAQVSKSPAASRLSKVRTAYQAKCTQIRLLEDRREVYAAAGLYWIGARDLWAVGGARDTVSVLLSLTHTLSQHFINLDRSQKHDKSVAQLRETLFLSYLGLSRILALSGLDPCTCFCAAIQTKFGLSLEELSASEIELKSVNDFAGFLSKLAMLLPTSKDKETPFKKLGILLTEGALVLLEYRPQIALICHAFSLIIFTMRKQMHEVLDCCDAMASIYSNLHMPWLAFDVVFYSVQRYVPLNATHVLDDETHYDQMDRLLEALGFALVSNDSVRLIRWFEFAKSIAFVNSPASLHHKTVEIAESICNACFSLNRVSLKRLKYQVAGMDQRGLHTLYDRAVQRCIQ